MIREVTLNVCSSVLDESESVGVVEIHGSSGLRVGSSRKRKSEGDPITLSTDEDEPQTIQLKYTQSAVSHGMGVMGLCVGVDGFDRWFSVHALAKDQGTIIKWE